MVRFIEKFIFIFVLSFCWVLPARAQSSLPDFVSLTKKSMPSFVNIYTIEKMVETIDGVHKPEEFKPSGSGFIADNSGYIITNLHVVRNASDVEVVTNDEEIYDAKVIGFDEETDIAILKIETKDILTPAKLGNSDNVEVGEWVLAIGNPFGLGGSVSKGIVSAKSRKISANEYDEFIQTDVQINQGNSGGPLFNMNGEIVGVNSILFSETGKHMGISFAVPSNIASWVFSEIREQHQNGEKSPAINRGYLGIKFQKAKNSKDIIISGIKENSSAKNSKLKVGDIINKFNGQNIYDITQINRLIYQSKIGSKVTLTKFDETKKEENIELIIEDSSSFMPTNSELIDEKIVKENYMKELGLELEEISGKIVVKNIDTNSDAMKKGIKKNSVIIKIDKKDVLSIEDVRKCIFEAKLEGKRPITLLIQSGEELNFATLRTDR